MQSAAKPIHLWPSEVLQLALVMWHRIARFRHALRRGIIPPQYRIRIQQWDEWEQQQHAVLQQQAPAASPRAPSSPRAEMAKLEMGEKRRKTLCKVKRDAGATRGLQQLPFSVQTCIQSARAEMALGD